jgi:predicted AAA+ superfamily ATPase
LEEPESLTQHVPDTYADLLPLTRTLWHGTMPGTLDLPDYLITDYYRSYIQTYVARDVRTLENIRELTEFGHFLGLSGALSGQEINASQLGRDVGVKPATARRWLDLLANTYQWLELFPYTGNTIKRLSGKRKGFLCDAGMASYLQRISSPDALAVHPLLGAHFEGFVVNLLQRQFPILSTPPQAFHWRTNGAAEVDLVLERDGRLYPIEIKCKRNLSQHDTRGIRAFRATYPNARVEQGLIIYAGEKFYGVSDFVTAVP